MKEVLSLSSSDIGICKYSAFKSRLKYLFPFKVSSASLNRGKAYESSTVTSLSFLHLTQNLRVLIFWNQYNWRCQWTFRWLYNFVSQHLLDVLMYYWTFFMAYAVFRRIYEFVISSVYSKTEIV